MDLLHGLGRLELGDRRPQHGATDCQQDQAQDQGRGGLKPLVAVGMVKVRILLAVMAGKQHHDIGHQVGQRMNAVSDQGL